MTADLPTNDGAAVVAAYEELRGHVLAASPRGNYSGLVLVLREGLVAWMARGRDGVAAIRSAAPVPVPIVSDPLHAGIVRVLANMALAGRDRGAARETNRGEMNA